MEPNKSQWSFEDHMERCRLCLTLITENDKVVNINKAVKNRFENLTSLELSIDNSLMSSMVCITCDRLLKKFNELRDELIRKQLKLCEYVNSLNLVRTETLEDEIQEHFIEEEVEEMSPEYLNEDHVDADFNYTETIEVDEESAAQIEFLMTEENDELCANEQAIAKDEALQSGSKKVLRPRAWTWSNMMERDLIKYYNAFKTEESSENSVFEKISKKFELKSYPKISGKSIKYKYKKLLNDTDRLRELEALVSINPEQTDDESLEASEGKQKRVHVATKKRVNRWNESMEVLLLHLLQKIRYEQPAISDNTLFRRVATEMLRHGHENSTKHNVVYHYRKMKRNEEKFERLMKKSKALMIDEPSQSSNLLGEEERTFDDHRDVDSSKRSYLHWNESMKEALLKHKSDLERQVPAANLWSSVARRMHDDGHGKFTPQSLLHKFYYLRRDKDKKSLICTIDQDELLDET